MKDLEKLYYKVLLDFERLNIPYGNIVEVAINVRAKSRWGICKKRPDGFHIEISFELLDDKIDDKGALDTIAHEICHTIEGCQNHGKMWKYYANILNRNGYRVERTGSAEDKGIDPKDHVRVKNYKYQIICQDCGRKFNYCKRGKVVDKIMTNPNNHRCTCPCGSKKLKVKNL